MNNTSATIEMLTSTNFKKWKEKILYALAMGDMDFALREDEPAKPNDQSTNEEKKLYAKWEKSNRLSLMAPFLSTLKVGYLMKLVQKIFLLLWNKGTLYLKRLKLGSL